MIWVKVKHIRHFRSKGNDYWYHRLTGERLPNDETARIQRAIEINDGIGTTDRHVKPGSVAAVANQYRVAPEYRDLADRTRKTYSGYLDIITDLWGAQPITSIQRRHVLGLRDKYPDTPAKSNYLVTVLRVLLDFAVDRDIRRDNPAKGVKKLKTGTGYEAWLQWAIERFLHHAGDTIHLALLLALYTGQREGDVLAMRWSDYDGERIEVIQSKTGTRLRIRVHATLRQVLDAHPRRSPIILTTSTGRPYKGSNFRHHWRKALKTAGLDTLALTFHGLRYTAASHLFEIGCTPKEVAAITGHRSLAMLAKYGAFADQQRMADAVVLKWEQNAERTLNGKPRSPKVSNSG
jgi:integrase